MSKITSSHHGYHHPAPCGNIGRICHHHNWIISPGAHIHSEASQLVFACYGLTLKDHTHFEKAFRGGRLRSVCIAGSTQHDVRGVALPAFLAFPLPSFSVPATKK